MPITPPQYDPNQRAQTAAQTKYGAAEAQIQRALEQGRLQEVAQKAALDQYGAAGRGVIGQTYGELWTNLEANRADTANQLGTQVNLVGQGYRDAGQLAEQARADSAARLSRLGGSIGLSGAAQAESQGGIEQLAQRLLANNAMDDATRTGNLRTWSAQQDALLRQGMAQAQREGAERKSSFENELVNALAELQASARNQEYGLQGNLLDMLNERGSFTVGAANDYMDQMFGQMLQAGQFNLSEQEAQAQAAARAAAQSLAEREFGFKQKAYEEGKGADSLSNMLALSQEQRAQRASDLDYQMKTKAMNAPQNIDEWARQQGIDDQTFNLLMDEYNLANRNITLAGMTDFQDEGADQSLMNYLGQSPQSVVQDRFSGGIPNYAGVMGPVAGDRRNAKGMTAAQIREAMSFLGRG